MPWNGPGAGTRGDLAAPLPRLATTHGLRLMSFDRPGYGGSEPAPVRTIAEAVADTVAASLKYDEVTVARSPKAKGPEAYATGPVAAPEVQSEAWIAR